MIEKKYSTHRRKPFFEIAQKYIKKDSLVLDIGAGIGNFSKHFGRNDFYLFDGNEETVSLLKKSNSNVYYGILPNLPFEDSFFDVIHCSHVVEHLQPEQFYKTLSEMNRCLKKGGFLIVSTPLYWSGFYDDLSHVKPYNPGVFKNYLCHGIENSRSRPLISTTYTVKELIFRYKEIDPLKNIKNTTQNFWVKVFLKLVYILRKKGLKSYEKTGYTLVLKK